MKLKLSACLLVAAICTVTSILGQKSLTAAGDTTTASIKVFGVCEQCKHRIEDATKGKGVLSANWDVDTKILSVSYKTSKTNIDKIQGRILAAGHDTYNKKANDADYNKLPSCCRYRELNSMYDTKNPGSPDGPHGEPDSVNNSIRMIKGVVLEENKKGLLKPLAGASVTWLGTHTGTITDSTGIFTLNDMNHNGRLIVSYSGYKQDTISVTPGNELRIILASGSSLQEVKIVAGKASMYINSYDPIRTTVLGKTELFRAACCNLSESFETNPSVDVSYNDAVTGSKQIQLLGLSGNYTQLTVENLPGPRGLATPLGLNAIPGAWIESIQLIKGTGSVANGFESIAGQINTELRKPQTSEQLFANVYENEMGKTDVNVNISQKWGTRWSSALLLHDDFLYNRNLDVNKDGFRDLPTGNLFSAMNRWSYDDNKGLMTQFGIKIYDDRRTGGQVNYDPSVDKFSNSIYGLGINNTRVEGFGKIGYVFPGKKYTSIGLQLSAFDHREDSYFGTTVYNGHQQNLYANLIYQSIITNTKNKFRTGLSVVHDNYNEMFKGTPYSRIEQTPGVFFEYTYSPTQKLDIVTGLREDHNSLYGWFTTPRLNVRYEPVKGTTIRASVGRGERTANIFAENNSVFASARQVIISGAANGKAYGLDPEVAWNKGVSIDQRLRLFNKNILFSMEYYRNDFVNQVIVDLENPREVSFYNLSGRSYSNSFQAELSAEPVHNLNVRIAYRFFDVKTTYKGQLEQKPFTAKSRAFGSLDYNVSGWKLDYTINYTGQKRIPSTTGNPVGYERESLSPSYITMNVQLNKTLGKKNKFDLYAGVENITNYFQKDVIIAAAKPFSTYFDASMVWGPVTGRMFYTGFRFSIK